jgi:hypothetical protein
MSLFDLTASTNARKVPILNTDYPQDVIIKATDGNASFKVEIAKDGRPDKYTYQWYIDGVVIPEATGAEYVRDVSGDKGVHTVWCEVTNKAGTIRTREATLTVKKVPVLNSAYPTDITVTIGKAHTFQIVVSNDGYPAKYTYQWYVNGNAVNGATGSSYTRTAPSVGAEYVHCVVTNDAGSVKTRTATLTTTAEYVFANGAFQNGYGFNWTSNSSVAGSDVYGSWNLYSEGTNSWAAAWVNAPISTRGKNKLIFTVSGTDSTTTDPNNRGYSRMGVTNGANLGNLNMIAQVSVRNVPDYSVREFVVDLTNVNEDVYVKILVDKTNTNYNRDSLNVSAIRIE